MVDGVEATWTPRPTKTPTPTKAPTPTDTPVPTPTPIDWSGIESPNYRDFFRFAERYEGKPVKFEGLVIQTINDCYRVTVEKTDYGWDNDSVIYACGSSDIRILDDDVIQIFGFADGLYTYRAVMGNSVEIPRVKADRIVLVENMSE